MCFYELFIRYCPQFRKAAQKHPTLLSHHGYSSTCATQLDASQNKRSIQITFARWIVFLNIFLEGRIHVLAAHVWRVRHHYSISAVKQLQQAHTLLSFASKEGSAYIIIVTSLSFETVCSPIQQHLP